MSTAATRQATIVGMSTLAVQGALVNALIPEFQVSTGATVKMIFDPTQVLLQRIDQGEQADFIVGISSDLQALVADGTLCADRTFALVRTGVGVAVSGDAEPPRLETVDQLKAALTGARSVAYSRTGASGIYFAALLHRLGIAEEVNSRATIVEKGFTGECVAQGLADLAIQQLSELAMVPGIRIAGPLPAAVQHGTDFSIGVFRGAENNPLVDLFLGVLRAEPARETYRTHGLEAWPRTHPMHPSTAPAQASAFVTPVTIFGNIAFVSGQLPRRNGEIQYFGRVGENVDPTAAQDAAALCAHACLAALDKALGSRDGIAQVLKLTGFVASAADFTRQGQVIDAASKVLVDALGAAGAHARSAIGVQQLPHGAAVEVELIVGLR